jgi:hypothetical protein
LKYIIWNNVSGLEKYDKLYTEITIEDVFKKWNFIFIKIEKNEIKWKKYYLILNNKIEIKEYIWVDFINNNAYLLEKKDYTYNYYYNISKLHLDNFNHTKSGEYLEWIINWNWWFKLITSNNNKYGFLKNNRISILEEDKIIKLDENSDLIFWLEKNNILNYNDKFYLYNVTDNDNKKCIIKEIKIENNKVIYWNNIEWFCNKTDNSWIEFQK